MLTSFETSLIVVAACLVFGFPVAYFLALKVENLHNQIAPLPSLHWPRSGRAS
jgi:ABC-type spermidine/putrescine transport system permease subunit I